MLLTVYGSEWPILCWCGVKKLLTHSLTVSRNVKSSRPKWSQGQNFDLGFGFGLKHLASACHRSQCFGLDNTRKLPAYVVIVIFTVLPLTSVLASAVNNWLRFRPRTFSLRLTTSSSSWGVWPRLISLPVAQPGSDLGEGPTIEHFTKAEEN